MPLGAGHMHTREHLIGRTQDWYRMNHQNSWIFFFLDRWQTIQLKQEPLQNYYYPPGIHNPTGVHSINGLIMYSFLHPGLGVLYYYYFCITALLRQTDDLNTKMGAFPQDQATEMRTQHLGKTLSWKLYKHLNLPGELSQSSVWQPG